jgi:hypothetical protein
VDTEHAVVYDGGKGKVVKDIGAVSPHVEGSILSKAFVVEAVDLSNLTAFMVSSDEGDEVRIAHFIG